MQKRAEGTFDEGVVNLKAQHLTEVSCDHLHTDKVSGATTTITTLKLDRGVSWDAALKRMEEQKEMTASIQQRQDKREAEEAEAMARAEGVSVSDLVSMPRRQHDNDDETLGGFIVPDGEEGEEEDHASDSEDDIVSGKQARKQAGKQASKEDGGSVIKYGAPKRRPFGAYNGFWTR
jgi:hypothetical protein